MPWKLQYSLLQYRSLGCCELDLTPFDTTTLQINDPKLFSSELFNLLASNEGHLINTLIIKDSLIRYLPDTLAHVKLLIITEDTHSFLPEQHVKRLNWMKKKKPNNFKDNLTITFMPNFHHHLSADGTELDLTTMDFEKLPSIYTTAGYFEEQLKIFFTVNPVLEILKIHHTLINHIPNDITPIKSLIISLHPDFGVIENPAMLFTGRKINNFLKTLNITTHHQQTISISKQLQTTMQALAAELIFHIRQPKMLLFCTLTLAIIIALTLPTSTATAMCIGAASGIGFFAYTGSYYRKPSPQNGLFWCNQPDTAGLKL